MTRGLLTAAAMAKPPPLVIKISHAMSFWQCLPTHTYLRQRIAPRRVTSQAIPEIASAQLVDWIGSQGVDLGRLAARVGSTGLVAARPVAKGEVIVSVPEAAWITKEAVRQSEIGKFIENYEPWLAVALFLISEQQKTDSQWRAYINSLPTEVSSPVAWPESDLKLLEGTQLLTSVQGYIAFFSQRYEELNESLFKPNPEYFPAHVFTYDAFLWAACTVRARAHKPLDGDDVAMVPLADLTQHARGAEATTNWDVKAAGLLKRGRTLVLEASRALQANEPISMDYSPGRTEGQTLLDHGVLDGAAAAGTYAITVTLPQEDRFFDDKVDILEQAGLTESNEFVLSVGSPAPEGLLATLRLINVQGPDAFLLESIFRNDVWEHMQLPLSEENERAVYQSMMDGCIATLQGYPTSPEQDLSALGAAAPGSREYVAAAVRLGEKEALGAAASFFEGRLGQLGALEYYGDRRLKRLGLLDKEGKPTDWDSFFDEGIA